MEATNILTIEPKWFVLSLTHWILAIPNAAFCFYYCYSNTSEVSRHIYTGCQGHNNPYGGDKYTIMVLLSLFFIPYAAYCFYYYYYYYYSYYYYYYHYYYYYYYYHGIESVPHTRFSSQINYDHLLYLSPVKSTIRFKY